jgi:Flp pilus assembly pilin Flp
VRRGADEMTVFFLSPYVEGTMNDLYFYLRGLVAREERGQTMAEYAVVLAVITVAVVAALLAFSGQITTAINNVGAKL